MIEVDVVLKPVVTYSIGLNPPWSYKVLLKAPYTFNAQMNPTFHKDVYLSQSTFDTDVTITELDENTNTLIRLRLLSDMNGYTLAYFDDYTIRELFYITVSG